MTKNRGKEKRLPGHMNLCAFWKARVRKELLSERDGNLTPRLLSLSQKLLSGRNYSLKEMETLLSLSQKLFHSAPSQEGTTL